MGQLDVVPSLFDPDGRRLVLAGPDGPIPPRRALTVFDAATGEARLTIRGATTPLAFSRDGRRLIALDPEKGGVEARVLDTADGRELARLRGHTGPILAAAFSPDGDPDRHLEPRRDRQGLGHRRPRADDLARQPAASPSTCGWSDDGTRLVGADDSANVLIWEAGPPGLPRSAILRLANP